jgi:outer membrane lipoprotein LolB
MRRAASLVGAVLVLAGCAHKAVVDDGLTELERQARLLAIPAWDMDGRLSVDTGESAHRASVSWQQRGEQLELEVHGFLGAGSFRVEGDAHRLTVTSRDGTQVLDDPELQLSEMFGWWLPVTSLEFWLLGEPDGDYPATTRRGAAGALKTLAQREWQIDYEQYQLAAGLLIPRSVILSHAPLELTLTITDFEPVPAQP